MFHQVMGKRKSGHFRSSISFSRTFVLACVVVPLYFSHANTFDVAVGQMYHEKSSDYEYATGNLKDPLDHKRNFWITGFEPVCGDLKGGTDLSIRGVNLDACRTLNASFGRTTPCAVFHRSNDTIRCRTAPFPAATDVYCPLRLQFDDALRMHYPPLPLFRYSRSPHLLAGQSLGGIVSGGTKVRVNGFNLECLDKPTMTVEFNGVKHTTGCRVKENWYMDCWSPKLVDPNSPPTAAGNALTLKVSFRGKIFGRPSPVHLPPDSQNYTLYPDPVLEDFVIDRSGAVVIKGYNPGRGYRIDDIKLRLFDSTAHCQFMLWTNNRIVCQFAESLQALDEHVNDIKVTVGNTIRPIKYPK